jgi:hypothetical protein
MIAELCNKHSLNASYEELFVNRWAINNNYPVDISVQCARTCSRASMGTMLRVLHVPCTLLLFPEWNVRCVVLPGMEASLPPSRCTLPTQLNQACSHLSAHHMLL